MLTHWINRESFLATRALSVSILEEGGRLGLKCLLLSYFRVGDKNEAAGAAIAAAVAGE